MTLCVHPFGRLTKTPKVATLLRRGVELSMLPDRRDILGRGAMNKVTKELVRGSAAAASLMVLVSVVGAGVKWG